MNIDSLVKRQRPTIVKALKRSPTVWTAVGFVRGELLNRDIPRRTRFMRLVCRSEPARKAALQLLADRRSSPPLPVRSASVFQDLDAEDMLRRLEENGFADQVVLPRETLDAIIATCADMSFYPDSSPTTPFSIGLAQLTNPCDRHPVYRHRDPHIDSETVAELAYDPGIVEIARKYLGMEPRLLGTQIWWSFPSVVGSGGPEVPEYGFHYDIDDYKFIKLFFYLVDVDRDTGPHVIVEGTHKRKSFSAKFHRRLTDEEVGRKYGGCIRTMTGAAGSGFFEDTSCYHKGTNPGKPRLILQIEYGVSRPESLA